MPDTERPAYPDLRDGMEAARVITDLDRLYTAPEPKPAFVALLRRQIEGRTATAFYPPPIAAPSRHFRFTRRWQPLVGLATAAVLILAMLAITARWDGETGSVSAQQMLDNAQAVTVNPAATGLTSYHLIATGKGQIAANDPQFATLRAEEWYAGNDHKRSEDTVTDAGGTLVEAEGTIINGTQWWQYSTRNGQMDVSTRTRRLEPQGSGADLLSGAPLGANSLADLLAQIGKKGCETVRQQGEATIAQRATYVIDSTPIAGACRAENRQPNTSGKTVAWVDKQTFLPLKVEQYRADGTLQFSFEATTVEYNVNIPASTFTYTPPPGATVTNDLPTTSGRTEEPKKP